MQTINLIQNFLDFLLLVYILHILLKSANECKKDVDEWIRRFHLGQELTIYYEDEKANVRIINIDGNLITVEGVDFTFEVDEFELLSMLEENLR